MKTISEPQRDISVVAETDVLVVGGGPAGVCAAVAAARAGARTYLVEKYGFLGGMWTAGMVLTLAGYNSWLRPYRRCVGGVGGEWLARAAALGGAEDNEGWVLNSDPETMKLVADELVSEAGAAVILHASGARPIVEDGTVRGAFIESVSGRQAILARVVVDATGDGAIAYEAGAPWEKRSALQPMTLAFRLGHIRPDPDFDLSKPALVPIGPQPEFAAGDVLARFTSRRPVAHDEQAMRAAQGRGELPAYGGPWFGGLEQDIIWVNSTRVYGDASDVVSLSGAEMEGRRSIQRLVAYFRQHFPGFADALLLTSGPQIGVRETRRIMGRYVLTGDDIRSNRRFADAIALGCWPIDIHPAQGETGMHALYAPLPYEIPYRCLVPRDVEGLLVTGRCISVTPEALGSTRVGATCAALGHAAGAAAALAAAQNIAPSRLDPQGVQALLRDQKAILSL